MAVPKDEESDLGIYGQVAQLEEGSHLFVLTFVGSFCPVTTAHVASIIESRLLLTGASSEDLGAAVPPPKFFQRPDLVVAFVSVNSDRHVLRKVSQQPTGRPWEKPVKPPGFFPAHERRHLIDLATAEHPWIETCDNAWHAAAQLRELYKHLRITRFEIDGADVALKTRSWTRARSTDRYICVGRPESVPGESDDGTQALLDELRREKVDLKKGLFLVTRDQAAVSSSLVRAALSEGNTDELEAFLHPSVIQWLRARSDR